MTVVIHFVNKRLTPKTFKGVYSVIHTPESYTINYADFTKMGPNGPEIVKVKFEQKAVARMAMH